MSYLTDSEIERVKVEYEINPWFLALMLSGWMWAAVWFVAFVASVIF